MYLQHFGLTSYPFSIAPDADVVYYNEQYRDAYAHLHYSIQHPGGIIVLTGEVGTGKTTLVRSFLNRQDSNQVHAAYIFNPKQPTTDLLSTVCQEFGIKVKRNNSYKNLTDQLYEFLIQVHKDKQRAIIIIDEAQHLEFDALEHLRLLTNFETGVNKLLQIILVGQEELLITLSQPELRQFNQRVVGRFHLRRLNEHQLFDYVQHRLGMANGSFLIIPKSLSRLIYRYTKGVPRLANILCDRALIGAYAKNRSRVDRRTLKKAAAELFIESVAHQYSDIGDHAADRITQKKTQSHTPLSTSVTSITQLPAQIKLVEMLRVDSDSLYRMIRQPALRCMIVIIAFIAGGWFIPEPNDQLTITQDVTSEQQLPPSQIQLKDIPITHNLESSSPEPPKKQLKFFDNDIQAAQARPIIETISIPGVLAKTNATLADSNIEQKHLTKLDAITTATDQELLLEERPTLIQNLASLPKTLYPNQDYSSLLHLWGVEYTFSSYEKPCQTVQNYQLTCAHIKADIDLIRKINLPTIIEWKNSTEGTKNQAALLVGFDDSSAILLRNDQYYRIANESLAQSWHGYGHYLIRAPKDFRSAFHTESTSDSIIWLINALTEIDEKYSLQQVSKTYNDQLVQTVKTFQKQQGLTVDGIAGFETLAKLNHLLYQAPQLEYIK